MKINGNTLGSHPHRKKRQVLTPLALAVTAAIASTNSAQAVQINFSYGSRMTIDQMIAMEIAGSIWSSYLTDAGTVNLHVETTGELPEGVVGGALPGITAGQSYQSWRQNLQNDSTSGVDNIAIQHRQDEEDKFTAFIDGYKIDNNETLNLTRANAKALGMLAKDDSKLDGYMLINNLNNLAVDWSYDSSDNIPADGTLDFLSMALHEVGHNLGFVSGVDQPGWLAQKTQYNQDDIDDYYSSLIGTLNHATPLDMFRHSTAAYAEGGEGEYWNDMSVGGNSYFSLDGGKTVAASLATGANTDLGGDGYQASHWKLQNTTIGIMNPVLRVGEKRRISVLDQQAMDVIGWDLGSREIDWVSVQNQAKERLAQQLGVDVGWLEANPVEAAQLLREDRFQDIEEMIEASQIYEWGWSRRSRGGSSNGWWQGLMKQHFLWQEVVPTESASAESVSVPEPSSVVGLLGLGVGLGFLRKSRSKK